MPIPTYDAFFNPLLQAMHILGGSASISEQEDTVATLLKLTDKEIGEIHKGNQTKLSYRLAWARTYLRMFGLLENSSRGVWSLTPEGNAKKTVDAREVRRFVQALTKKGTNGKRGNKKSEPELPKISWEDELLEILKNIPPDAFERLCQRLLRESGFIQVEVTGRSGDGGIDGKGVVRVGGILSFHVNFQCKRYRGSVSPSTIRDFRGALMGRADKGLIITTGSFTKDARREAQRDGASPIDLIDGNELVEKLKQLEIGVEIKQRIVEEVSIKKDYFDNL
jgi:restriction system protein